MSNEQVVNQETFRCVLQKLAKIGRNILPTVSLNLFNGALEKDIFDSLLLFTFQKAAGQRPNVTTINASPLKF